MDIISKILKLKIDTDKIFVNERVYDVCIANVKNT